MYNTRPSQSTLFYIITIIVLILCTYAMLAYYSCVKGKIPTGVD